MANTAITLCRMVDKMMMTYQKKKEEEFIKEGGLRERMTAARLNYRNKQNEDLIAAQHDIASLQRENAELRERLSQIIDSK